MVQSSIASLLKRKTDFKQKWLLYFSGKFEFNAKNYPCVSQWFKSGGPRRLYNNVTEYKIVTSNQEDVVQRDDL